MKKNNIPFLEEDKDGNLKLSKLINASNTNLKKDYNIDLSKIINEEKSKTTIFSEQEIGEATIHKSTAEKDETNQHINDSIKKYEERAINNENFKKI